MTLKTVYVALGSNLDNPLEQLKQAVESLKTFAIDFEVSPFYGSKPLGPQDQPDYVNAVAKFKTDLAALDLLDRLQQIENLIDYNKLKISKGVFAYGDGEKERLI